MSFQDQLNADLTGVFFSDFKDKVQVNGVDCEGYLARSHHEFGSMGGSAYSFECASSILPAVKKGDRLVRLRDNKSFAINDIERSNSITRLIL
ncbi:hypothetical protein [Shewanella surugensis]|uniref:Uncharacterized protein n=1 Tax=Shewanella surugensis TaxID=212020 RepID=A0ABT0L956_9GAMM|nr:hypothetical protein [Shewanella surugensis]MCL1124234.1 hypothetical protein [Shewanella surugensis]